MPAQLTGYGGWFVFFNMKGELEDDPNNPQQRQTRSRFLEQTGADYVRFVRQDLPINPLYRDQNPAVNAQIANEIASLIRCFAPQLGANQQQALSDAYQRLATPDFPGLLLELQQNGVTGVPVALISRIVDYNLFASAQTAISPEQWLRRVRGADLRSAGSGGLRLPVTKNTADNNSATALASRSRRLLNWQAGGLPHVVPASLRSLLSKRSATTAKPRRWRWRF